MHTSFAFVIGDMTGGKMHELNVGEKKLMAKKISRKLCTLKLCIKF